MLLPMPPTDSLFLILETREHPMHVGGLHLYEPVRGSTADDIYDMFQKMVNSDDVAPLFRKRPKRSLSTAGQWGWEEDEQFDIEHHVRHNALPKPGRVLELLALCSRLHSTLLDRHRPLWEMHLIEGLDDGRFAMYFKIHHALMDGVSASRLLQTMLSKDPAARDMPAPWGNQPTQSPEAETKAGGLLDVPMTALRGVLDIAGEAAGLPAVLAKTVARSAQKQATSMSFAAPKSMFNVPITGARRFAAQSWPIARIHRVRKAVGATVNDVVLAMSSGALRTYMLELDALPEAPLIAMVPVALRTKDKGGDGGNAVGAVMCNLGTDLDDPAARLETVHQSMLTGKEALAEMTPVQILAMSGIGMSPIVLQPLLDKQGWFRPPFNIMISNVPGPRVPLYFNGARLDGMYPLSVPTDGQALNITCTSYDKHLAFGLTGCRRSVPHLQRLLTYLDEELDALEVAVGLS